MLRENIYFMYVHFQLRLFYINIIMNKKISYKMSLAFILSQEVKNVLFSLIH